MAKPLLDYKYDPTTNSEVGMSRIIAPFVACGDLSGFDSDMTYPVQVSGEEDRYTPLKPTQAPINPPYKTACSMKRGATTSENQTTATTTTGEPIMTTEDQTTATTTTGEPLLLTMRTTLCHYYHWRPNHYY
ncbi:Putative tRNA (cytidine(32)/guanosine(34)-2'-O)-methyltransferase [Geodia barretti]|uniref:tRNA (Cytidine(32)/guanosine(34)-2'-O)-methyltransferase n=1 Tax=Geodia barretti TaxID=519541 RepID=A0AA35WAR6_GEOBA|nr:Putative tRNA (cytidine(32)/guanosine(34)-2'-O)-methyltransferase [Geodia barretti]